MELPSYDVFRRHATFKVAVGDFAYGSLLGPIKSAGLCTRNRKALFTR